MSGLSQHVVHPILLSCPAVLAATPHIHTCHDWVGPVIISEFVSNPGPTGIPAPGSADSTDWIELYNNGTQPVDLEGWILSDNKDPAQGWTMPSRPLRPAEYLLVYVTGGGCSCFSSCHAPFCMREDTAGSGCFPYCMAPVLAAQQATAQHLPKMKTHPLDPPAPPSFQHHSGLHVSGPGPNGTLVCGAFGLSKDGERLYLFDPRGTLVSSTGKVPK